jgi:hypothetical protein
MAGEKCTWMVDALLPQYVGHIGCAPDGTADVDASCMHGAPDPSGYDSCKRGLVCGDYRAGEGVCKHICDPQGGIPTCDAQHVCGVYPGLFNTGPTTPAAAGVCDLACDPLTDNDFDGSALVLTKTTMTCGADPNVGCYGYPSFGTPPKTAWSCRKDVHAAVAQPIGLRHRVQCTSATGCAGAGEVLDIDSCNQGYLPLLLEMTGTTTVICTALCKPKNCFSGSCGPSDENRLGEAPHRCTSPDRVGTFDTSANGEHCRFLWSLEVDDQDQLLRSPTSDSVGFCFDHSKYRYDSDNNNMPDTVYPPCASLPDGFGSGTTFGAADLGCVDTTHAQLAHGKAMRRPVVNDLRPLTNAHVAP